MALDTVLVIIAVAMMFATFAIVLAWGDRQTRTRQPRQHHAADVNSFFPSTAVQTGDKVDGCSETS